MKEMWDKISAFFAPGWWIILAAAVLVVLVLVIVIKAKNSRIYKLKRQLKAVRTELETSRSRESVIVRSRSVNSNAAAKNSGNTAAKNEETDETVKPFKADDAKASETVPPQTPVVETVDLDEGTQSIYTAEKAGDDSTEAAPEPDYYTTPAVVAPSSGSIKFTVVYDRPKDSWVIKKDGVNRVVRRVDTKEEAMQIARELCRKYNANLVVHKKDGKFQKH